MMEVKNSITRHHQSLQMIAFSRYIPYAEKIFKFDPTPILTKKSDNKGVNFN